MNILVVLYCSILGLIIGSAINAIVWRLNVGRSWAHGRSMCPDCKHALAGKDLIPVISWLTLKGACRYCHKPIHWQYPLVESVTALLFGLSAAVLMPFSITEFVQLILWLIILTLMIILAVYDARWFLLPNKVMLPLVVIVFIHTAVLAGLTHNWSVLFGGLQAAVIAGGGFLAIAWIGQKIFKAEALGGGDIKLVFVMGLLLGLKGTALALLIGCNVAAFIGVILILARKKGRREYLPFGPFLIGATIFSYLYGQRVVDWYLRLNGFI